VPIPTYAMPRVAKLSAGFFAHPGMDAVDLFVGAEGTLGVITEATLRVEAVRPASCLAFVTFADAGAGLACAARLRDGTIDLAAIEHMDASCLKLLREAGVDRLESVNIASGAAVALLVALDLPPGTTASAAYDDLGNASGHGMLSRFAQIIDAHGGNADVAVPGDPRRHAQLLRVREAVPSLVNQRIRQAGAQVDARIEKVAADVVVPFEALEEFAAFIDEEFASRGLDGAVWGHLSDGNLHPNVMPRSFAELERGRQAMLAIGREAIRRGGAPLAEHGVGRNPVKQQLLAELYGTAAIDEMRRVKAALDPEWKLAPGVIMPERDPG
jgi:D-lactate dehydrogenase (cytochrome)